MQIFHLGYPKCGSTTIQNLLHADPAVNFLGKPYRTPEAEIYVREHLAFSDLRQLPAATLADMRRVLCEGQPIISEELLSGVGFAHGMAANSLLQVVDNIDRLTGGDFEAHVILRQPAGLLRSHYGQIARMGGALSFDQYCSLILLRRHHWLMAGLNYRNILDSDACRSGKLKPVLFEELFAGGGLADYMRKVFGARNIPDAPEKIRDNSSDTDSVIDHSARSNPHNPAIWIELSATRPSLQEYRWIDRLPEPRRTAFLTLWRPQLMEGARLEQEAIANLIETRRALGHHRGRRPVSELFAALLAEIADVNEGVIEDFPHLPFARHGYFNRPAAATPA
jgi:hypothetical protein